MWICRNRQGRVLLMQLWSIYPRSRVRRPYWIWPLPPSEWQCLRRCQGQEQIGEAPRLNRTRREVPARQIYHHLVKCLGRTCPRDPRTPPTQGLYGRFPTAWVSTVCLADSYCRGTQFLASRRWIRRYDILKLVVYQRMGWERSLQRVYPLNTLDTKGGCNKVSSGDRFLYFDDELVDWSKVDLEEQEKNRQIEKRMCQSLVRSDRFLYFDDPVDDELVDWSKVDLEEQEMNRQIEKNFEVWKWLHPFLDHEALN